MDRVRKRKYEENCIQLLLAYAQEGAGGIEACGEPQPAQRTAYTTHTRKMHTQCATTQGDNLIRNKMEKEDGQGKKERA